MKIVDQIYNQIKMAVKSLEYLELGNIDHINLLYPLQKLEYEEWAEMHGILQDLTQDELGLIANSLVEIKDNKISNYDTGAMYAFIFTISNDFVAECLLENFDFIDNNLPKDVELIDELLIRLKNLDGAMKSNMDYTSKYSLIYKLYNEAVC